MRGAFLTLLATLTVLAAFPVGVAHEGKEHALVLSNVVYEYVVEPWEGWSGPTGPNCGQNGVCSPYRPHAVVTFDLTNDHDENVTNIGASFTIRAGISATQSVSGLGNLAAGEAESYRTEPPVYPAPQLCVRVGAKTEISKQSVSSDEVCVTLSGAAVVP